MKNKGILKFFAGLAIGIGIGIAFGAAFSQGKIVWRNYEKLILLLLFILL